MKFPVAALSLDFEQGVASWPRRMNYELNSRDGTDRTKRSMPVAAGLTAALLVACLAINPVD